MLAIPAIYEGGKFFPLEEIPAKGKFKVIITFVESMDDEEEVRNFAAQTDALSFWEHADEDIYQDFLEEKAV
jgi:predicted DNA-binding antitoxin AbrB/MazE fold protein